MSDIHEKSKAWLSTFRILQWELKAAWLTEKFNRLQNVWAKETPQGRIWNKRSNRRKDSSASTFISCYTIFNFFRLGIPVIWIILSLYLNQHKHICWKPTNYNPLLSIVCHLISTWKS